MGLPNQSIVRSQHGREPSNDRISDHNPRSGVRGWGPKLDKPSKPSPSPNSRMLSFLTLEPPHHTNHTKANPDSVGPFPSLPATGKTTQLAAILGPHELLCTSAYGGSKASFESEKKEGFFFRLRGKRLGKQLLVLGRVEFRCWMGLRGAGVVLAKRKNQKVKRRFSVVCVYSTRNCVY